MIGEDSEVELEREKRVIRGTLRRTREIHEKDDATDLDYIP